MTMATTGATTGAAANPAMSGAARAGAASSPAPLPASAGAGAVRQERAAAAAAARRAADGGARVRRGVLALVALVAGIGAYRLSVLVGELGFWPGSIATLSGRAILSAAGKVELAPQLAAFPPVPYLLLFLAEWIARPLGLSAVGLASGVLAGGLLAIYLVALRRAGYPWFAVAMLALLFALNPLVLHAVARGPQTMLLLWGVWMVGMGMFGFRATSGVNALLSLSLGLALMALTSERGLAVALASVPFLLLAVPPDLRQRAYGSVYLVLLFPLIFAVLFMVAVSAMLLGGPFAFITPDMLQMARWSDRPLWLVLAAGMTAVLGSAAIGVGLIVRSGRRRPVQAATAALLGTAGLAVVLSALLGLAESALHALTVVAAATAVFSVHWPREPHRTARVTLLLALGFAVSASFIAADQRGRADARGTLLGLAQREHGPGALALGRWLRGVDGVMLHGLAHPEVVAARGSAGGLLTSTTPAFQVSLLSQRIFADHVVARVHRPGNSDDAISRAMPDLYRQGPPGYRLAYDSDGWRVWSRHSAQHSAQQSAQRWAQERIR